MMDDKKIDTGGLTARTVLASLFVAATAPTACGGSSGSGLGSL